MWRWNTSVKPHHAPLFTTIPSVDVGGVQVRPHPEESSEGETGHDAALRSEAAQDPDQVPGPPVEEEQHEDHVGHLPESPPPAQRRLGLRKW